MIELTEETELRKNMEKKFKVKLNKILEKRLENLKNPKSSLENNRPILNIENLDHENYMVKNFKIFSTDDYESDTKNIGVFINIVSADRDF